MDPEPGKLPSMGWQSRTRRNDFTSTYRKQRQKVIEVISAPAFSAFAALAPGHAARLVRSWSQDHHSSGNPVQLPELSALGEAQGNCAEPRASPWQEVLLPAINTIWNSLSWCTELYSPCSNVCPSEWNLFLEFSLSQGWYRTIISFWDLGRKGLDCLLAQLLCLT